MPSWTVQASSSFKRAFSDVSVVDRASDAFDAMIADQRAGGAASGDHFAKPGANDRVWNALEKLAVRAPSVFATYYANDIIALVSAAWLGPAYQITSQVNVVNPGGEPQIAHRDYHLGFMSGDQAAQFPAHAHLLSPVLTLQGAVAHCDMPVESGPTCTSRIRRSTSRATSRRPSRSSGRTSRRTRSSSRLRRATRRSSTRRCSTAPGTTARPTSGAWRTCFRCPRPSVERWRAWIGSGCAKRYSRRCCSSRPPESRSQAPERHRGLCRGVRLPDQPRPRPAGGRHRPADPGRTGLAGRGGGVGPVLLPPRTRGASGPTQHQRFVTDPVIGPSARRSIGHHGSWTPSIRKGHARCGLDLSGSAGSAASTPAP